MKLSSAMFDVLDNAANDRPLLTGAQGRSQHGGRAWTIIALKKRQLITAQGNITPEGVKAWRRAKRTAVSEEARQ